MKTKYILKVALIFVCIVGLMLPSVALASPGTKYRSQIYPEASFDVTDKEMLVLKLAKLLLEKAPTEPGVKKDIEIAVNIPIDEIDPGQLTADIAGSVLWQSSKFTTFDYINAIGNSKGTVLKFRNVRVNEFMNWKDPEVEDKVNELLQGADKYSPLKDKLAYINDTLSLNTKYSYDHSEVLQTKEANALRIVLVEHKGACTHFAMTVKYLLSRLGVPVVGAVGGTHMTTFVYIDGEWKLLDLTWNICGGTTDEIVSCWYKGPDGKPVIVRVPAIREFFLISSDDPIFRYSYMDQLGESVVKHMAVNAEYGIALEYPELALFRVDYNDVITDINALKADIVKNGGTKKIMSNSNDGDEIELGVNNDNSTNTSDVPSVQNDHTKVPDPVGNTSAGQIDPSMVSSGSFSISTDSSGKLVINNKSTTNQQVNQQKAKAQPTSSSVIINGKRVGFEAYNINGYNYFKLRDIAMALNGTGKQFEVKFDGSKNAILITTGSKYTAIGGELKVSGSKSEKPAVPTPSKVYINGKEVQFTAYNIDGYNYFKLRDIGKALNFGVFWDGANNTIRIDTTEDYKE